MSTASVDITPELIRRHREEVAHQSQVEAAEAVGVAVRTWQGWEAGTTPQPRHRRALLAWLTHEEEAA